MNRFEVEKMLDSALSTGLKALELPEPHTPVEEALLRNIRLQIEVQQRLLVFLGVGS